MTGGAGPSCGWIEPPKVTIVQVGDLDAATFKALFDDTTESNVKTRAIDVSGEPATERTSTLSDGRTRVALTVPSRRATLIAAGPDPALLARIVGSARVFDVDVNGCTWQVPRPPSWDRVDSAKAIDVGQADLRDGVQLRRDTRHVGHPARVRGRLRSSPRCATPSPGSRRTRRRATAST